MSKKNLYAVMAVFLCAAFLLAGQAWAGTISISSSMKSEDVDGKTGLAVKVRNDGDEAARAVQIHLEMGTDKQDGPKWDLLNPKEEKSATFFFEVLPERPGTYPVYLTIEFADLNMYPFTALNIGAMQVGARGDSAKLFAKADRLEFSKSGTLPISLKNLDEKPKKITARVIGPRELTIKPMLFELDLKAGSTIDRTLEVTNFSALPGAGYPLFIVFEYDQGDLHYSHPLVANVKIAQGGLSTSSLTGFIAIGAALLLAIVGFEVLRRVKSRKQGGPKSETPIAP